VFVRFSARNVWVALVDCFAGQHFRTPTQSIERRLDDLYYRISPELNSGDLQVADGHRLYWEESGNLEALPIVLVHGGPSASNPAGYRVFIDPERCRIIHFDQRGCGRSEPRGLFEGNSLQNTLAEEGLHFA